MPSNVKLFLFILAMPFLAAVAHDVYLNNFSSPEKIAQVKRLNIDPDNFEMTDLGWVWLKYSPESYQVIREAVSSYNWKDYISPALSMSTIIISSIPLIFGLIVTILMWLFGIGPFKHLNRFKSFKAPEKASVYNQKTKKAQYGRK
jgi:hypothetical protein